MEYITALDISYGTALLPRPFERHTNKGAGSVSLSAPGCTPSYLWVARAPDANPIVDIVVLYGKNEETPPGYKRVARELSGVGDDVKGEDARVYIAYKVAPASEAVTKGLVALTLLREDESPGMYPVVVLHSACPCGPGVTNDWMVAEAGWTVLERSLTRNGPPVRLALSYSSDAAGSDTALTAWAEGLKLGDIVDCLDKQRRWRVARVAAVSSDGTMLTISFKGWTSKYDEELPRTSKRLAKPGVHTAGKDTRAVRRQGEAFAVDLEVLAALELRIDDYMSGEFPVEERVRMHM